MRLARKCTSVRWTSPARSRPLRWELTVELRLPEMFEEWTRTLGYEVTRDGDGLVLAKPGGELRYY